MLYYLLPNRINQLRAISKQKYLPRVLKNIRHDIDVSDQFANYCLGVFNIYCALRAQHSDEIQFFTKTHMDIASYFPKQLPDAHIQLGATNPKLFLLDFLRTDQPFFLATRAVIRYIDYADEDRWPEQYDFSKILLVCDSISLEKRLVKRCIIRFWMLIFLSQLLTTSKLINGMIW
jgi:hypothetical protein